MTDEQLVTRANVGVRRKFTASGASAALPSLLVSLPRGTGTAPRRLTRWRVSSSSRSTPSPARSAAPRSRRTAGGEWVPWRLCRVLGMRPSRWLALAGREWLSSLMRQSLNLCYILPPGPYCRRSDHAFRSNHMTCGSCKFEFCWTCGDPLVGPEALANHFMLVRGSAARWEAPTATRVRDISRHLALSQRAPSGMFLRPFAVRLPTARGDCRRAVSATTRTSCRRSSASHARTIGECFV
jgi:hypothetical protein